MVTSHRQHLFCGIYCGLYIYSRRIKSYKIESNKIGLHFTVQIDFSNHGQFMLACFRSYTSLLVHIAANVVGMVVNVVALDSIHPPDGKEKTPRHIKYVRYFLGFLNLCEEAKCQLSCFVNVTSCLSCVPHLCSPPPPPWWAPPPPLPFWVPGLRTLLGASTATTRLLLLGSFMRA